MNRLAISFSVVLGITAAGVAADWVQYAQNAQRSAVTAAAPHELSTVIWSATQNPPGTPLVFEGPSSPVVFGGRVYANARVYNGTTHVANKLVAIDAQTGAVAFERQIDKAALDSWSSPAGDVARNAVLLGCGSKVFSIDATSGALNWATPPLDHQIVNASVAVADDLTPGRAFTTDYDGFGDGGSLYCINLSPFDVSTNPYQPGDIVWQEPIGGSSGNTPAYFAGTVYVASVSGNGDGCDGVGQISAFDVSAPSSRLKWSVCTGSGFFGGVCYSGGFIYAAGYSFSGSGDVATMIKVRASDGTPQWTALCERTASIPVISGNRIYLSAGLQGFGSVPKVEAYRDDGASATKLWDTYVDSGNSLVIGGWTHQPVIADGLLYVGKIPLSGSFYGPYTDFYIIDPLRTPADPAFIRDHRSGMGSSPAIASGRIFTIGPNGLFALATPGDCNGDSLLDGRDIACFVQSLLTPGPSAATIAQFDFDGDHLLTPADIPGFIAKLLGT